jgi:hypothetical protein
MQELLPVISEYINKWAANANSLHAYIYKVKTLTINEGSYEIETKKNLGESYRS